VLISGVPLHLHPFLIELNQKPFALLMTLTSLRTWTLLLFDGRWPLFHSSTDTITAGARVSWQRAFPLHWDALVPLVRHILPTSEVLL
ncbi:MAG: hypothetical protein AAFO96_29835, partial [Bacteroidota bacterium]